MTSIPNTLTIMRMAIIPLFVAVYYLPTQYSGYIAATLFAIAGFTDWLDGFLARKLNQTSRFGAFLDPVADKLMVAVALVLLVGAWASFWMTVPALIIVGREILISALREWMAEIGKRTNVAVNFIGKLKTGLQMLAILILLAQPADWGLPLVKIGMALMYFSVAVTLWSMFCYLRAAWQDLKPAL